ncbi:MAG: NAD(P)H-hydrate dehydratase [Armatimonadota bacterium]|nr:MAG: NAD(P)H-hydrate dehydratase [Armatimonadota bacterium]
MKIVTAEQMRELDRKAIEERGIPGLTLMENAGRAVAESAARMAHGGPDRPIVIICGRGNNGGDGFVAARHLAQMERRIQVFLAAPRAQLSGDAEANLHLLDEAGLPVTEVATAEPVARACARAALVVDALLGTGLSGNVRGLAAELIEAVNQGGPPVLAVDVPSGLDADWGKPLGIAVRAAETVTMGLPKLGLFLHPGMDYAGRVTVADIGFPSDIIREATGVAELIGPEWVRVLLPRRTRSAHKGDFGRVLVIAGSVGMTGAACLCADAALRVGAGLVTVGCPASINDILETKLTEAMTVPLPETYDRSLDTRALAPILELAEQAGVLAIGPGLSRHPETAVLVRRLVARVDKPMVIDADALNALADAAVILEGEHAPAVLTPHPGEMARLMGVSTEAVQAKRAHFAEAAANRCNCVIILKGACALVAESGRPLTVNPTGNPGMASGGTGDVLTGMVAGLIVQGLLPFEAAAAGAYLHGLAGDLAAQRVGEESLVAGDLLAALPDALCQVRRGP